MSFTMQWIAVLRFIVTPHHAPLLCLTLLDMLHTRQAKIIMEELDLNQGVDTLLKHTKWVTQTFRLELEALQKFDRD